MWKAVICSRLALLETDVFFFSFGIEPLKSYFDYF